MKKLIQAFAFILACATSLSATAANPQVELKTNKGAIVLELYPEKAPRSVDNFLQYVKDGFYNGTQFHRVIAGFMIQGGGFDTIMRQKKTRAPIPNEGKNGLRNDAGTIAMARTADPDSATAQFFINLANNDPLNADFPRGDGHGYAVFGKVVKGMDVVQTIGKSTTGIFRSALGVFQDVPDSPIIVESAKLLPAAK